jgi:hypothetical protein
MPSRAFDLNIEEVLENWDVEHALREVIANALDEQFLSQSAEITITKDERGNWHVRDFGRGLRIEHFTLNENQEKLQAPGGVIGKFGVGLKDALATFHRRGIRLLIGSHYGAFRVRQEHKHGFSNILTLHIDYDDSPLNMRGTEFVLGGIADADVAKAKALFMKFAGEEVVETTPYGQILKRQGETGRIYILGVFANEEPNFLFSYNITSLTDSMKKRLNRERLNVGRTTYADRVKAILKSAKSETVKSMLIDQVEKRATGEQCDEMGWIDVSQMALILLHDARRIAYLTEHEVQARPDILDNLKLDGFEVVVVTDQQKGKLQNQADIGGQHVRTLETYQREYNASFQYEFVDPLNFKPEELHVYRLTEQILALVGLEIQRVPRILISETIRITSDSVEGVWDPFLPAIVVKRSALATLAEYAATLLHEIAHAMTGSTDSTREFESVLTTYLGKTSAAALRRSVPGE